MAVYTVPDRDELDDWLASHGVGSLASLDGIESGIENSNFFVATDDGGTPRRFVLTIFERLATDALSYCLALMDHLAARGIPCPAPIADADGRFHSTLAGKPAALVTRLAGRSVPIPTPAHCASMGRTLAAAHLAIAGFSRRQANPRGVDWWIAAAARVRPQLQVAQRGLLDDEIALQASSWSGSTGSLPRGAIHADLFRDNALFVEERGANAASIELGGIVDFYFAGDECLLFDLAVCLNDWCVDPADGCFDRARLAAFVAAYDDARPLTPEEREAFPLAARAAALRFWLSRLDDLQSPRPAALLVPHDPTPFERILACRRSEALANADPLER